MIRCVGLHTKLSRVVRLGLVFNALTNFC